MDRNGVCFCGDGPSDSSIVMWGMLVQMVVVDLLLGVADRDGAGPCYAGPGVGDSR